MPRIWFNHTYATNNHVIDMLRDNPQHRSIYAIGSHTDPDSPVLAACDEAHPEPEATGSDYVEWALAFAGQHRVQILFPRLHMAQLCAARAEFAAVGTVVAAPDEPTVSLFADKAATYRSAAALGLPVPPHRVVTDATGLRAAVEELAPLGLLCLKPITGVGGAGFRILSADAPSMSEFTGQPYPKADLDRLSRALDAAQAADKMITPLLVAPFLTGPEISVDAVADRDGITRAAIGRRRSRRRRLIVDDQPARHVAETLNRAHRVSYLSNTQVRYWQSPSDQHPRPYLLEVNTRISGGLFQTVLAGINLPWIAVQVALDEPIPLPRPRFGAAYTTVTSLVALDPASEPRGQPPET